jgi:hypothetical protein
LASDGVRQVGIQYLKEIGRDIDAIQAGAVRCDAGLNFRFFDPSAVYAAGFVASHQPV